MPSFIICFGPSQKANRGPTRPLCQSCYLMLLPYLPSKELPQVVTPFLVGILKPFFIVTSSMVYIFKLCNPVFLVRVLAMPQPLVHVHPECCMHLTESCTLCIFPFNDMKWYSPKAFPIFRALPLPCIILNENQRTKNGGCLGTRLPLDSYCLSQGKAQKIWL